MEATFERLKELTAPCGVSGNESAIAALIRTLAAPFADEIKTDALGNVLVRKGSGGKKLLFAAHMDTVGLIVTHIDENGFVRFGPVGGLLAANLLHTPVVFSNGVRGVIRRDETVELRELRIKDLYADIRAADRAAAQAAVQLGDTAVYDLPTVRCGSRVFSPYMDDRVGCLVLLQALERLQNPCNEVWFAFTVQEEVGLRGAKTAAYGLCPDYGFAVDVTRAGDIPEPQRKNPTHLGGGAAIKIMDSSIIAHPRIVALLEEMAAQKSIPVQRDILVSGGTDAGEIHRTHTGVPTGGISVPARGIHTPCESVDLGDVAACVDLVTAAAEAAL